MGALNKALAIKQKLAESSPNDVRAQSSFADYHNDIGDLLAQTGKPAEALQWHEKAQALLRIQAVARPDSYFEYVQIWLAQSLERKGVSLAVSGKPEAALEACKEALAIFQKRSDDRPTLIWYRSELAGSLSRLGAVQWRAGQPAEAVASLRRAIALVEQLPELTPRNYYSLASCHAQLAGVAAEAGSGMTTEQGKAEAERAMATLQHAVAAGFGGIGRLRSDACLDSLRPREDFQKLVKKLEAKFSKTPEVAPPPPTK